MHSRLLAFAFCLSSSLVSVGAQAQVWSAEKTLIVNAKGAAATSGAAAFTPSIAIGISVNGKPVVSRGYGNISPGGPLANGETIYEVGSVSKQITAAATLALIEDTGGKFLADGSSPAKAPITLDMTVQNFIPDSGGWSTAPVTLRNLLNMQSGFVDYTSKPTKVTNPYDITGPVKPRDLLRYVFSMLSADPSSGGGKGYVYSNTNYFLLANVIEFFRAKNQGVTNYDYRTFIRPRIFTKAGMTRSGFVGEDVVSGTMAPPSEDVSKGEFGFPAWPKGAGEVRSTASDLLKWHAALMGDKIISAEARKIMFTNPSNGIYAMGWEVFKLGGYTWYRHSGFIPGYTAYSGIFVKDDTGDWVSVALLTNKSQLALDETAVCLAQLAMDPSTTKAGLGAVPKAACKL